MNGERKKVYLEVKKNAWKGREIEKGSEESFATKEDMVGSSVQLKLKHTKMRVRLMWLFLLHTIS